MPRTADPPSDSAAAAGPAAAAWNSLAALSLILDLANGFDEEKSQLTAALAFELARDAGLPPQLQRTAFLGGLLRHLGCTAFASREARFADDDITLRRQLQQQGGETALQVAGAVIRSNHSIGSRLQALMQLGLAAQLKHEWLSEACGAARTLAARLGCDAEAVLALDQVFERWDGHGGPRALGGDELSVPAQVVNAAHVAVLFWLAGGAAVAAESLQRESGRSLAPPWAQRARDLLRRLDDAELLPQVFAAVAALPDVAPLQVSTLEIAATFGDFADLQCPHTRGHSQAAARMAEAAALQLGLPAADVEALRVASHLHDIGQVSIPTSLWLRPRVWRDAERERARTHVQVTERILMQAPALVPAGRIARTHHERLDGSGYPRGVAQAALDRPARLLAVVEMACGMREPRPHRPAFGAAEVARQLRAQVSAGRLDAACVDAVLSLSGQARTSAGERGGQLTEREIEVLRLLATGLTNKQIARAMGISDRTVQTHTVNIYQKLDVDTRAGAALMAARLGWLAPE